MQKGEKILGLEKGNMRKSETHHTSTLIEETFVHRQEGLEVNHCRINRIKMKQEQDVQHMEL